MDPSPTALGRAMESREMRLAVFDVGLRKHTGQWYLEESIPLGDVVDRLSEHDGFWDGSGTLELPLHEPDSAALTNEYLRVAPGGGTAQFYDPGVERVRSVALTELERAYPAWRLRFWSGAYPIEEPPAFMLEFDRVDGDPGAVPSPSGPDDPPRMAADAFFEAVRSTLVATKERRRDAMRSRFERLDTAEFIDEHGGITDIRPSGRSVDEYGQQVIELAVPSEHPFGADVAGESGLRPGDEVVVDAPDAEALPVEAELFAIDADAIELGVYWDSARGGQAEAAFDPASDRALAVGKLVDGRRFSTIADAIETVDRTDHARQRYAGTVETSFADLPEIEPDLPLNRDQERAVRAGFTAEDVLCIHAPPWTGSRRVIWELAHAAVETGERVCIFVPDHDDLDVLLGGESADPTAADTSLRARADATGVDLAVLRSPTTAGEQRADIVVLPLDAADGIEDHSVDLAIVDRANRIDVPAGAVPFAKAGRVVALGDPWQGRPSMRAASRGTDLAESLYEHLRANVPDATVALRCQYRMHQAIAQFPNRHFYEGTLIHGGRNRTWTIDTLDAVEAMHVPAEVRTTPTGSVYHDGEIEAVLAEVRSLRERGLSGEAIGVLTPYSAQVGKLRVALNELEAGLGEVVLLGGIEAFGCQHRDAVIVSFVGAGDPDAGDRREGERFATPTGLNIAMTRGTKRLVLIGDWTRIPGRGHAHEELASFLTERGLLDVDLGQ